MRFRLRFDVVLFGGLCLLLAAISAGAAEIEGSSGKPAASGPVAVPKTGSFELIEYVSPAHAPERAGGVPALAPAPRSVSGAEAGTTEVEPNDTF